MTSETVGYKYRELCIGEEFDLSFYPSDSTLYINAGSTSEDELTLNEVDMMIDMLTKIRPAMAKKALENLITGDKP